MNIEIKKVLRNGKWVYVLVLSTILLAIIIRNREVIYALID